MNRETKRAKCFSFDLQVTAVAVAYRSIIYNTLTVDGGLVVANVQIKEYVCFFVLVVFV